MSDLYIDGAMLRRVQDNFRRIEDLLSRPARQMREVTGRHVGPSRLVDRVNEFGEEWEHGIGQLGEFSGSVVESLQAISDVFEETDTNLANALNDARDGDR